MKMLAPARSLVEGLGLFPCFIGRNARPPYYNRCTGPPFSLHSPTAYYVNSVVRAENVASVRLAMPFQPPLAEHVGAAVYDLAIESSSVATESSAALNKIVDYAILLNVKPDVHTPFSDLSRRIRHACSI